MQVQLTANKQSSNPAFGHVYKFVDRPDVGKNLYEILNEVGAELTIDCIGGKINGHFYLATGKDALHISEQRGKTNLFIKLAEKVKKARKRIIKIVLDPQKGIEEQLNISLKPIEGIDIQEIEIVKTEINNVKKNKICL